jgi:hypothetical protein
MLEILVLILLILCNKSSIKAFPFSGIPQTVATIFILFKVSLRVRGSITIAFSPNSRKRGISFS